METADETDAPDLRQTPGGWLAVATDWPRVAVVADTRDSALEKFRAERATWRSLRDQPAPEDVGDASNRDMG